MNAVDSDAQAALDRILSEAARRNVYRGQVLVVEQAGYAQTGDGEHDFQIQFHDLPAVARDEIILPEEVLKVVERNVIGLLAHSEVLRKAGRSTHQLFESVRPVVDRHYESLQRQCNPRVRDR